MILMIVLTCLLSNCLPEIEVINKGIGGNSTEDIMKRLDNEILNTNADWVLLMVGTNDMLNTGKMLSYESYGKNLDTIVAKLTHANIKVLLISPPTADQEYLFQRHDEKLYTQFPNDKLKKVRDIMQSKVKENQIYFVDIFQEFIDRQLPLHNEDSLIRNEKNSNSADGVHPTKYGYQLIARIITTFLIENNLIKDGDSLICLGDSITFGVHVHGEGTAEGETYPAYLKQYMNF